MVKLCTLNLWDHGWEIEDICFAMIISRSSLFCWWRIFAEHGSVTCPQVSIMGPKRIINRVVPSCTHCYSTLRILSTPLSFIYYYRIIYWNWIYYLYYISGSTVSRIVSSSSISWWRTRVERMLRQIPGRVALWRTSWHLEKIMVNVIPFGHDCKLSFTHINILTQRS